MEAIELCNIKQQDQAAQLIMKGKRTKRPRLPSPLRLTMADDNNSGGGIINNYDMATTTTTSTANITDHHLDQQLRESTEEEEDMANCLILLAQGHTRKPTINSDDNNNKVYVYQCKTCERCFPSFQALGGHRASHKKPKPTITNTQLPPKTTPSHMQGLSFGKELEGDHHTTSTTLSLHLYSSSSSKCKVHECSICGAEFSSGQALGGHMRRHRSTFLPNSNTTSSNSHQPKNNSTKNLLKLDLNLPAPDDDHTHTDSNLSSFPTSKENLLLFSASSLVHCHY